MQPPRMLDLSHRVELDQEGPEVGVGVVAPFDFVLDREYWRWAPAGVSVYITRTPYIEHQVGIEMAVHGLVRAADDGHADAVFVSCTTVRTFDLLADLERRLNKPVLSANQVTMWAALRAAGLRPSVPGQGLFACRG